MTLRDQILNSPETLSDFGWVAEQRFRDAEVLLGKQRYSGCVYLFGVACEMWLKLACFEFLGGTPQMRVDDFLGPAKTWMRQHAPQVKDEAYHSLLFWSEYLLRRRRLSGRSLGSVLAGELRHHVNARLFQDWQLGLRYRGIPVSERHAWRVYNDVLWVREYRHLLWR